LPPSGVRASSGDNVASPQAAGIRAVVRAGSSDVKRCYEWALTRPPGLAGRMAFDVTVSAGTVTQVEVATDEPGDEVLVACIRGVIEAWRFDAEVRDTLHIPFVFNAS
jgi:hypothetical protein